MKISPSITQNKLFAALPEACKERLLPHAKLILLSRGKVLYRPEIPITHLYFPVDAIVALVYLLDSGSSAEVSMIGNEGVVGIFSMLSEENTANEAQVLSMGYAYALPKRKMQEEFNRPDGCAALLLKYVQSLCAQISQTAVCNRHHTIDQQLCRLLLLALDRLPCNNLTMTHDVIAQMLGVRRGGVSEAANRLQRAEIVEYHRGHIKVLDRKKLEALTCECYSVVRRETDKLFPPANKEINERSTDLFMSDADHRCALCFKYSSCIYRKKPRRLAEYNLIQQDVIRLENVR